MTARVLKGAVVALAVAALAVPAAAAKGPPVDPGEGEETGNNLAVPALFVGTTTNDFGLTCDNTFMEPQGEPSTGFPVDGYYYVQGVNEWQATCGYADSAMVNAAWGDNLGGDARLKVGSPIRVELGLLLTVPTGTGWDVIKLEPEVLDRYSAYGILATPEGDGWTVSEMAQLETRVWSQGATLTIQNEDTGDFVTDPEGDGTESATAEINATGRIVYGYNLRVPETGSYVITYYLPGVDVTSTDIGTVIKTGDGDYVTYTIDVGPGGGNGGGGGQGVGGGNGGGKGHKG